MADQSCRTCEHWGDKPGAPFPPLTLRSCLNDIPDLDGKLKYGGEGTDCPAWQAIGGGDET